MNKSKVQSKIQYRNFLDICDLEKHELEYILDKAAYLKQEAKIGNLTKHLQDKQLAMIFEKASTRTRVSFEVGINQLGGSALYMNSNQSQLGRGEPIKDTANVLSRYVDLIMIRTFEHDNLLQLAENSSVPVINGLTDYSHPCQIVADLLTIKEHFSPHTIEGLKIVWLGDVNNVLRSWVQAAELLGLNLVYSCPEEIVNKKENADIVNSSAKYEPNPQKACQDAAVIMTDTWVSMGDKDYESKITKLEPYQVNDELMSIANQEAIFMHCLPAHRGEEVTSSVIDGEKSVVYDEAENRLHSQKAIMLWCLYH